MIILLKEALDFIFTQAKAGDNPEPRFVDIGKRKRLMILKGKVKEVQTEPAKLVRKVTTLDSIASIIRHEGARQPIIVQEGDAEGSIVSLSQVYVSESGVTVVLDETDRTERVTMDFAFSPQFQALKRLEQPTNQKALVTALRSALYGCCGYIDIVNVVRKIQFNRTSDGKTTVEHGRESLGRSVEKAVQSMGGEIPEELTFVVSLFSVPSDVPTRIELRYAIDIDVDNENIKLVPIGDIETRERQRVINDIAERLDDLVPSGTLVVSGTVG